MQQHPTPTSTPKTPRKRTPVKKEPTIWFEPASKLSATPLDLESISQAVKQLRERQHYLEEEWHNLLERLQEQEDSMDSTQEEDETN